MRTLLYCCLTLFVLTLYNCEDDPCDGVSCDRGTCINGLCDCETGYGGPDCSTALMPASVTITSVEITDWPPAAADGSGWDPFDAPDVYLQVQYSVSGQTIATGSVVQNALPPVTYTGDIVVDKPEDQILLSLFDQDAIDNDDFMAGALIVLGTFGQNNDFANTVDIDLTSTSGLRMVLTLAYEF